MTYRSDAEKRMLESLSRTPRHYGVSAWREMDSLFEKVSSLNEFGTVHLKVLETIVTHTRATAAFDEINRRALEALAEPLARSRFDLSKHVAEEMLVLTDRAFHRGISTQIAALAHAMKTPDDIGRSRFLNEVVESFNFLVVNLSHHSRESIRNSLAGFQHNAAWAALDTIKTLGSQEVDSSFSSFLKEVFNETRMLDESDLRTVGTILGSGRTRFRTSNEQQLTVWLIVFSLLIALYSAIQTGQPVQIDSNQLAQIVTGTSSQHRPRSDAENTYIAERASLLKARPRNKSEVLGSLLPQEAVRLIYRHHKWAFVQYIDQSTNSVAYGWTYKKYLRPERVQRWEYLRNTATELSASLTQAEQLAINEFWEETNMRRVELIDKKVEERITEPEKRELEHLQRLADERIRRFAPLPLKELEMTLEDIKREL